MARVQHLRRQKGLLTTQGKQRWWRHWREPYLLALSISWPQFLGLLALVYLGINLLFAGLYRLDPGGLAGTADGRPASPRRSSSACRPWARSATARSTR